jgi:hemoglobin-like flavoprotein
MNDYTIQLVKESFDLVEPMAAQAADLFYANLAAADPALRAKFEGGAVQGPALVHTLAQAIASLREPERLMPGLQRLAQQLASRGMRDADYDTVGAVLLDSLAQGLGPAFDEETRDAWIGVYGVMAGAMKDAAAVPA